MALKNMTCKVLRILSLLLLAVCLAPTGNGHLVDGRHELSRHAWLYSAPAAAAVTEGIVEPPQRAGTESVQQKHVFTASSGQFAVEFVGTAALLSREVTRGFQSHFAHSLKPMRAPPLVIVEL